MKDPYRTVECDHAVRVDISESELLKLGPSTVRVLYPRLDGECPLGCGYRGIAYASKAHYVAGDW